MSASSDSSSYVAGARHYRVIPTEFARDGDADVADVVDEDVAEPASLYEGEWASFKPNTSHLREPYDVAAKRLFGEDEETKEQKDREVRNKQAPFIGKARGVGNDDDDDEDRFKVTFIKESHKALYRFIKIVASGVSPVSVDQIIDWYRFVSCYKDGLVTDENFENDIHLFVNLVNFVIVRVIALLREFTGLSGIGLLDLIFNEQACNHFAALVCDLWKDGKLDRGVVYMNVYAMNVADQCNYDDHTLYFKNLKSIPAKDMVFASQETIHEFVVGTDQSFASMSTLYITPSQPLLFFVRLALQAMHAHSSIELTMVLANLGIKDQKKEDATPDKMRMIVFNEMAALGYADALGALHTSGAGVTSTSVFEWVQRGPAYRGAFLAHLVATYTNLQYVSKNKTDSRKLILERLLQTKNRLVEWLIHLMKT